MPRKSVPPSISAIAFDCPHCGAYTTHTWYALTATAMTGDARSPGVPDPAAVDAIRAAKDIPDEDKKRFVDYFQKILRGSVVVDKNDRGQYVYSDVGNLHVSKCFNCGDISVWVASRVVFPSPAHGPAPNPDLPSPVLGDYDEASRVLPISPRGAAALLRLAIQKLCTALGEKGRSIDDDIASLVKKGLSPVVQKALDSVRVIGNEAVHPGALDLKDDVDTASRLFDLVNIISEQMISNPKHIDELYAKLPEAKRKAIEKRDGGT